jgi:hypothetical protein
MTTTAANQFEVAMVIPNVTRKTEELDHERLPVTVILVLSQTVIYIYGDYGSAHSSCKATNTYLYIIISDGKHVFGCSVEQTDHSAEQRLSLVYYRGDPSLEQIALSS